eukprot:Pgem_evm1s18471
MFFYHSKIIKGEAIITYSTCTALANTNGTEATDTWCIETCLREDNTSSYEYNICYYENGNSLEGYWCQCFSNSTISTSTTSSTTITTPSHTTTNATYTSMSTSTTNYTVTASTATAATTASATYTTDTSTTTTSTTTTSTISSTPCTETMTLTTTATLYITSVLYDIKTLETATTTSTSTVVETETSTSYAIETSTSTTVETETSTLYAIETLTVLDSSTATVTSTSTGTISMITPTTTTATIGTTTVATTTSTNTAAKTIGTTTTTTTTDTSTVSMATKGTPITTTTANLSTTATATATTIASNTNEISVVKFEINMTWTNNAWGDDASDDSTSGMKMIDVDMFDTTNETIAKLKANNHIVVCYISAGTVEDWRSDVKANPDAWEAIEAKSVDGWEGETWIDITKLDDIIPLMTKRWEMAKAKGCDAIEADNVDCYQNKCVSGYTEDELKPYQLAYNKWQSELSHNMSMSIGLKNTLDLVNDLVDYYDFAINEECIYYTECEKLEPFVKADKAIFNAEYSGSETSICDSDYISKYAMKTKYDLGDGWNNCFSADSKLAETVYYFPTA